MEIKKFQPQKPEPQDQNDNLIHFEGEVFKQIGRLHFLVQSKSDSDMIYAVDLESVDRDFPDGGCSCPSFQVRKYCRHHKIIKNYVEANK